MGVFSSVDKAILITSLLRSTLPWQGSLEYKDPPGEIGMKEVKDNDSHFFSSKCLPVKFISKLC